MKNNPLRNVLVGRKQFYIIYTLIFLLLFFISFSLFKIYGKVPIWESDGISQHYPNLIYQHRWLRNLIKNIFTGNGFVINNWDPAIGFGEDVLNVISFRPISLLSIFFAEDQLIVYLWVAIALRLYLSGTAFYEYGRYMKFDPFSLLISSLLYAFCSFSLVYAPRHYLFIDMLICLPLVCLGLEKIFNEKRPFVLTLSVTVLACTYFYMLYIVAVFAVIYFFIHFFFQVQTGKKLKSFAINFLICAISSLLGVLMAMAILLPMLFLAYQSNRQGETVSLTYASQWHYTRDFYVDLITEVFNSSLFDTGLVLGISGLAGITVLYVFISRRKKYQKYIINILIVSCLLMIPVGAQLFNAFSGNTQRWSFGLHFFLTIILCVGIPELKKMEHKTLMAISAIEGAYILVLLFLFLLGREISFISIATILIFTIWIFIIQNNKTISWSRTEKYVLFILVLVEISMKALYLYSPYGNDYISSFHDKKIVNNELTESTADTVKTLNDTEIYRIDEIDGGFYESVNRRNYGLRNDINGVSSYFSYSSGNIKEYVQELGIAQQPTSFSILGLTHRAGLNSLNSVKYLTTLESNTELLPYGYKLLTEIDDKNIYGDLEKVQIYENQYFLPYMFTYDSYIPMNEYSQLSPIEKEQAMLQGIVLEGDIDYPQTNLDFTSQIILNSDEIITQLKENYGNIPTIRIEDNKITTLEDNMTITINFNGISNAEAYLQFDDLLYVPMVSTLYSDVLLDENSSKLTKLNFNLQYLFWKPNTSTTIAINDKQSIYLTDEYAQYFNGAIDAVGNIGYSEAPRTSVSLRFANAGEYNFSNISIICQSMDGFDKKIENLKQDKVTDIKIKENVVTGTVETDEKKMLCINIPYNNGWKAYVNGKEAQIFCANTMYMGVFVEKGINSIELQYTTPGADLGKIISVISISIFGILCFLYKFKRKH